MERTDRVWGPDDVPVRPPDANPTTQALDPRTAFLWTRVDGVSTVSELGDIVGLDAAAAAEQVARLARAGLVTLGAAPKRRTTGTLPPLGQLLEAPAPSRATGPMPRVTGPMPRVTGPMPRVTGPMPRVTAPIPAVDPNLLPPGPRASDIAWLSRFGVPGAVPSEPWFRPGQADRYVGFQFDTRALLEPCDLTIEQKKEIVFVAGVQAMLDAFELLGIEPTTDRKVLKNAYFTFSKRFHPDSFFRKQLGSFGDLLQRVYKDATDVHDLLQENDEFREVYARVVSARNLLFRARLEADRSQAEAARAERAREETDGRKAELQALLQSRVDARRSRPDANPVSRNLTKAETYYAEGMKLYTEERFVQAAASLQLALTFDPHNDIYRQAFERVNDKAKQVRAEQIWKRGVMADSIGQSREALALYREALEYWRRHDYLARTAELMLSMNEDLNQAAELARLAGEAAPQKVDYLLLLGRIYEQASLTKRALATYERALQLDPKSEAAKKAVRALK